MPAYLRSSRSGGLAARHIVIRLLVIFLAAIIVDGAAVQTSYGLLPLTKTTNVVTSITTVSSTTGTATSPTTTTTSPTTLSIQNTTTSTITATPTISEITNTTTNVQNTQNATSPVITITSTVTPDVQDASVSSQTVQNATITVPNTQQTRTILPNDVTENSTSITNATISDLPSITNSTTSVQEIITTVPDVQDTPEVPNVLNNTQSPNVSSSNDNPNVLNSIDVNSVEQDSNLSTTLNNTSTNIANVSIISEVPSLVNDTAISDIQETQVVSQITKILNETELPNLVNNTEKSGILVNAEIPGIVNDTLNLNVANLLNTTLNLEQELLKPLKTSLKNTDTKVFEIMNSDDLEKQAAANGIDYFDGKVRLDVELADNDGSILNKISTMAKIELVTDNRIQIAIPVENLNALSSLAEVKKIQAPQASIPNKDILIDGQIFEDSLFTQNLSGTDPVTVAVIDLAFDVNNTKISHNIKESVAFRKVSGDTDPVKGLPGESPHGTAIAEIIAGVAPNVNLRLYTASNELEFINAIDYAISRHVDMITISSTWINHNTDGSSVVTKKVEEAIRSGITVIMPSGNYAQNHWAGTFVDSDSDGWNEFTTNDEGMTISVDGPRIMEKKPILVYLRWADSSADFDITLSDSDGKIVDYSSNVQDSSTDTVEYIHFVPKHTGLYYLGITCFSHCSNTGLELFSAYDKLEYTIPDGSVGVPTDAAGAIVVGALENGHMKSNSSVGPTDNGLSVPNFYSPDGIATTSYNGKPLFGSSSSTTYVSGLIALLFSEHHNLKSSDVKQTLISDISGFAGKIAPEQTTALVHFNQTDIQPLTNQTLNMNIVIQNNQTQTMHNTNIVSTQNTTQTLNTQENTIQPTTTETPQTDKAQQSTKSQTDQPTQAIESEQTAKTSENLMSPAASNQLAHELYQAGILPDDKQDISVPSWYQNVISWWHDKKVSDSEFKDSVNYMLGKISN